MSDNIHDTKIDMIKRDVDLLIKDLSSDIFYDLDYLKNKYHYLFTTSSTLFNLITNNVNKKNFNKDLFYKNIDEMLKYISLIQKNEITQHNASENIGTLLAEQFIPKDKLK